jgi:type II secretory pathway pseudopilin PulG
VKESERAFTLVETVVALGILAVLLAAGGAWLLAMHPGALTHATTDYDAALASARAYAETSGNGATLVFAPRDDAVPGFTLRVYSGRPIEANSVQPTTAMPVESDALISEATLGKPPFAIFIGASGHVSGKASYPTITAKGVVRFPAVAKEPACPSEGFVLTFTGPQGATAMRTLPCTALTPGSAGLPNPSPTPNLPLVTPTTIVYHWPADAEQTFVATEWGYTHWFTSTTGFACGTGVAAYPNILPKPYSPPYTKAEGDASPAPPNDEPFSYPNSGGASMNDAPAMFRLDPSAAGLCAAVVSDDYGQVAQGAVQVMGWLTATYGGKQYTHLSTPSLALPASALPKKGSTVTIALTKTFDAEALQPAVALDAACSSYVTIGTAPGTTPATPRAKGATASITLTLVTLPKSKVECGGVIYDQYPSSQAGEGVPINVTLELEEPLAAWPPAEQVGVGGASIGTVAYATNDPVQWLNRLAGGADAIAATPCLARAYTSTGFGNPISAASFTDAAGKVILQTDSAGCILDGQGNALPGAAVASEPGYVGDFDYQPGDCGDHLKFGEWLPSSLAPGADHLALVGASPTATFCTFSILGDTTLQTNAGLQTPTPINVAVTPCRALLNQSITAPVSVPCVMQIPDGSGSEPCVSGDEQPPYPILIKYFASFSDVVGRDVGLNPITTSPYGTLNSSGASTTFTRSQPGPVVVYVIELTETAHKTGAEPPEGSCAPDSDTSVDSSATFL